MSSWADGLPGARRIAREIEREKHKEREGEGEKGGVNVKGLVRGWRFNFGYDMGEITHANESEISETQYDSDESPRPSTNSTKDKISSNNNVYNIPSHQRRYRLQGHPSSYNDYATSDQKKQAMTKLWLEQNPTLVFRLPSPEDDDVHAENPLQVLRGASQKRDGAHQLPANLTRVWHAPFLSIEEGDDDDNAAHAEGPMQVQRVTSPEDRDNHAPPPASDPSRVWRVPSPIDDDDDEEDSGDDDDASAAVPPLPPPIRPSAAGNKKRHVRRNPPRLVREVRMGRHIVTNPADDTEWVSEDLIISRGGGGGGGVEKRKIAGVERKSAGVERNTAGVEKKVRRRGRARKISASGVEVAAED